MITYGLLDRGLGHVNNDHNEEVLRQASWDPWVEEQNSSGEDQRDDNSRFDDDRDFDAWSIPIGTDLAEAAVIRAFLRLVPFTWTDYSLE